MYSLLKRSRKSTNPILSFESVEEILLISSSSLYLSGNAECLPFEDETFDLVITRLSLHHFVEPEKPFREMQRVLKKGGKLVIWDMVATTEELRETNDAIETMRDNSHTRILSREEFEALFEDAFELQLEETTLVPVNLQSWMDLTSTPEDIQKDIIDKMEYDLNGGCLISEYNVGTPLNKYQYVKRDRLQSGICQGVLVVLPLVPVIPITGDLQKSHASSISPITFTPAF